MDKLTYLAELAEGLARWVPERERQDILRYYAEYFEEAGPDREAEVIRELGDPWALSCRLAVEGGFVTQEQAEGWTPPPKKKWPLVLIGAAAVLMLLIGSAVSAAAWFGRTVFATVTGTTPVQTSAIDEIASVEEGTGFEPGSSDVVFIEGEETDGGFWSMEDGYLDAFYDIDANISLGNITVTGGEDYSLAIQPSGNLGGYSVKWEIQGDTLKIRDSGSGGYHIGLDGLKDVFGQKGLDVIITVPEGEVLQKVDAKTDMGNIYLANLDVEVKVTGETNMGNVDGFNIRTTQKVELKTSMGNVTFGISEDDLYSGNCMDIDLETDMGDVEVNLECYESECAYKLETDLGKVTINGESRGTKAERKGGTSCKLDAESDMGNVDVYFYDSRWQ